MFAFFSPEVVVKVAQERGAQVASTQAGAPQIIMRAGFGEAALVNVSKDKAISSYCENVAMLSRRTICSQSVCQSLWSKLRT